MDQNLALKWADALESGEYEQGIGKLRHVDLETNKVSYCCIGVLCEIHPDIASVGEEIYKAANGSNFVYAFEDDMLEYVGLGRTQQEVLIGMNDGRVVESTGEVERKSFKEIAAWIRENMLLPEKA